MPTLVRRTCLRMLLAGVCGVAAPLSINAAQRQSATLEGTVQDPSGAVVGNAAVTVREADTGRTRTTRAGSAGSFRFTDLPIGTYEVRAKSPGFAPYVHAGVTLAIGQTARLLVLQPPQVVEQVAVSAQPAALDSRQTSIASVVDTERIEESPGPLEKLSGVRADHARRDRATPSPVSGAAAAMDFAVWRASAFLQDHWTPVSTLTLDGGVRFDTTQFPSSVGISNRQFSPLAGAAWTAASNWVIPRRCRLVCRRDRARVDRAGARHAAAWRRRADHRRQRDPSVPLHRSSWPVESRESSSEDRRRTTGDAESDCGGHVSVCVRSRHHRGRSKNPSKRLSLARFSSQLISNSKEGL